MSSKVHALKTRFISPKVVLNTIAEEIENVEEIYVVTIEQGVPVCYASGDLSKLCLAAVTFNNYAQKMANGEIEED